ncbi:YVTN family beta-propeller protein [Halanaerobium saccharolyticum]|uniref:YVTN family beta-propeller protein n=1 Tax=Halanaerobium saccharolyticum TaxID=43595 RepID=A0A4R6LEU4_9FIRM|nr:cytochrome D1 domain-containing protein [Halanaerobium saccharolyticum]TDO73775.1 YVTN family beta-propeller protein [Halanaerobium saccharolyticum]
MKKLKFTQIITFGFIFLAVFISSISVSANSDDWTRTSSAEGVSLEIKFANSAEMNSEELLFEVYLSTHSGNLLDNNFEELITIRNEQDYLNKENISWEWERESSHHPIGLIKIKNTTIDGQKFYSDKTEYLELEINGIREESHRFRWNINQNKKLIGYIPNAADGTVSVIDIDAEKVINTLEVGEEASHGIEITPDGRFLYTGDFQNGLIKIFDLSSNELIKTLEVNSTAHGIDMSPDGKYILVASGSESEVAVIDTAQQEIIKVIEDGIGDSPSHIDFDPAGKYAILTNLESDDVSVISIPDFKVTVRIPVGDGPNEGRVAPDGRYSYTANWESNSVSVIDLNKFKVVDEIEVGEGTHGVIVSPDSKKIWTANRKTNNVAIIDAETRQIERYIAAGEYANHLEFTPDGKKVVVTNARDNEAILIDTETYEIISRIKLGEEPHEISFLIK